MPPEQVVSIIAAAKKQLVSFGEKDLSSEGPKHTKALYLTLEHKKKKVPMVLVDNGFTINVCPLKTAKCLGLGAADFKPSTQTIRAYDNTKRGIEGMYTMKSKIGPIECEIEFHVIDILASFNLLLGRPWLHQMKAIASTLHQKVRLPWKDGILTLDGEKDIGEPVCKVEKDGEELSLGGFEMIAAVEKDEESDAEYDTYVDAEDEESVMERMEVIQAEVVNPDATLHRNSMVAHMMKKMDYFLGMGLGKR